MLTSVCCLEAVNVGVHSHRPCLFFWVEFSARTFLDQQPSISTDSIPEIVQLPQHITAQHNTAQHYLEVEFLQVQNLDKVPSN